MELEGVQPTHRQGDARNTAETCLHRQSTGCVTDLVNVCLLIQTPTWPWLSALQQFRICVFVFTYLCLQLSSVHQFVCLQIQGHSSKKLAELSTISYFTCLCLLWSCEPAAKTAIATIPGVSGGIL